MLKWLTGRQSIPVWVIKQIDDNLLHLCGQGSVEPRAKRSDVIETLHAARYQGAVSMANGLVLNAQLFAALAPLEALQLDDQGHAHWRGRTWYVSQVPQRCWTYDGSLVSQRQAQGSQEVLISVEDVSGISRHIQGAATPGSVDFGPPGVDEHPLIEPRDREGRASTPRDRHDRQFGRSRDRND
ncbi:hypothetical protein [Billgrantia saliphila]|uniref:hypothetical protein n=1 Tax=Billgrantia saliphila TaxID=1848458 RepID=UPI000CE399C5|nr:hypothetical protein [Halomonas saliphila]